MNRILAFVAFCLGAYYTYKVVKLYLTAEVSPDIPPPTWWEWLIAVALTLVPPSIAAAALIYLVKTS